MLFFEKLKEYNFDVLLVDDSKVTRAYMSDLLKKYNLINIDLAFNGLEAIELMKNKNYDLIISDLEMPELNGIELVQVIRENDNDIPIIIISALSDENKLIELINSGVDGFFMKPFEEHNITLQLVRVLSPMIEKIEFNKKKSSLEYKIQEYIKLVDDSIITSSTDLDGNITYVSKAFCNISGYTKDELIGQNHRIIKHDDMKKEIYEELWQKIINDETWIGEIKNKKKNGEFYWVNATVSPTYDEDGTKIGYTAIRQDITDKKKIEEISITDGLTSIYNRRHFNELFPKLINSAKRTNELIGFIIMDIDHFKQYNDTYGHQMGDDVLVKVAAAIKESLHRADDNCFRLGGEEFGVLFKATSKEQALEFSEKIRKNIEGLHIEHEKNSASKFITASIGLICKNANEINSDDEIYKQGDELLYKSKESGRNTISTN